MISSFEMYPTIITPFLPDLTIDYESLGKLIDLFAFSGCDGIFAVCQSSEMFFLSDDEKLELAAFSIRRCHEKGMRCVVSGHTQDRVPDQIAYLKKLEALKPDAIILVNNRFAAEDEPEETALRNMRAITDALQPDTLLGVYECPYPYKRTVTSELLGAMLADGRFRFMKDTCCRIEEIKRRIDLIRSSELKLYNANSATLSESLHYGAGGYSGVMLNIMPEQFAILKGAVKAGNMHRAEAVLEVISAASTIEYQNYPANAKYGLVKRGIFANTLVRNGKPPLTESQMKEMDAFYALQARNSAGLLPRVPAQMLFGYEAAFPECHASSVLPLEHGRALIVYFAGSYEKADDVGIWLTEYENGCPRPPRRIAKIAEIPHWNPVIYESGSEICVLFKAGKEIPDWKSYLTVSADGGKTWSVPKPLSEDDPAGGPVRCKPLTLANGAILAPTSVETADTWRPFIDLSLDGGKSFRRLAEIPVDPETMSGKGAIQPTLWESAPGTVHALLRTTAGTIFRSDSEDGGKTWCTAYSTGLPNNNSGIDLTAMGTILYLAMNPVSGNWAARTPLVILRSEDQGRTFRPWKVLSDSLLDDAHACRAEFSYPAIVARDGKLHITFTYNRKSIAYCVTAAE